MKRALVISTLAALGALTVACSDDTDALTDGSSDRAPAKAEDSTETPPSTKKSDTNNPAETPKSTPPADSKKPPSNTGNAQCSAAANASDCAKCCGEQNNPLKACGCNAGSACADKCNANLCTGGMPDLACGLCLAQQKCELGDGKAAQECIQTCTDKFGEKP